MHVVQAGHAEGAVEIVHAGLRTDQMLQLRQAADGEEAAVADGHRVRPGLRRVEGVEAAVLQEQVGMAAGRRMAGAEGIRCGHGSGPVLFFREYRERLFAVG
ncbi:hypothetical protein D3C81_1833540 [compost metagenome]